MLKFLFIYLFTYLFIYLSIYFSILFYFILFFRGLNCLSHENFLCRYIGTYVPTLPLWTGGSRFHRVAPVLQFIPEISRFKIILAWMSDICEFSKLIALFINSMWKSWLLVMKLGAYLALGHSLNSCFVLFLFYFSHSIVCYMLVSKFVNMI